MNQNPRLLNACIPNKYTVVFGLDRTFSTEWDTSELSDKLFELVNETLSLIVRS